MLEWIEVRDFRCHEHVKLELHPDATFLIGRNARGKTSLLEAICMLLRLQSPRTTSRQEMVRHDTKTAMVEGRYMGRKLRNAFSTAQRRLAVDDAICGRGQDYLSATGPLVWMDHSDMNLLRGGSECRRRYLDATCSQITPAYLDALRNYDRALRSRNYTLKRDAVINWRQADAYARIMEQAATVIWQVRAAVVERAKAPADTALKALSEGSENMTLHFRQGASSDALQQVLLDSRADEERTRSTAAGPHRDDIAIFLNQRDASTFASEGQQRSLSLAMKLAQATLLQESLGCAPLLLMDDVFGELDPIRRSILLNHLPVDSQKIITTTGGTWLDENLGRHYQI
jgi:DNA replication and repair protein RecF